MPLITAQNARELQAKAAEARTRNRLAREAMATQAQTAPPIGETMRIVAVSFVTTRARRIEKLIDLLLSEMASCEDSKAQQAKATALDKLYQTYADMTGIERRGVSRGTKRRPSQSLSDLPESPEDQ